MQESFTVEEHVSQREDDEGNVYTVVLQKTASLPAEVVYRNGAYRTDNDDGVMVIPGEFGDRLRKALEETPPPKKEKVSRKHAARVKRILGTKDDDLADAVAVFVKQNPVRPKSALSCRRVFKRLAKGTALVCMLAIVYFFIAGYQEVSGGRRKDPENVWKNMGILIDWGQVLACTVAFLVSVGISKSCAAACALLLFLVISLHGENPVLKSLLGHSKKQNMIQKIIGGEKNILFIIYSLKAVLLPLILLVSSA